MGVDGILKTKRMKIERLDQYIVFNLDIHHNKLYETSKSFKPTTDRKIHSMVRLHANRPFRFIMVIIHVSISLVSDPEQSEASQSRQTALRPIQMDYPIFQDDLNYERLSLAIRRNLSYLKRLDPQKLFYYGPHLIPCRQILDTQHLFLKMIENRPSVEQFDRDIRRYFRVYRAAGRPGDKKILFTGYYEPVFDATLEPEDPYNHPIYRRPNDLIRIDLSLFSEKYSGESIVARIQKNGVLPYYTRYQIEVEKVLAGRKLEIAWLKDPFDVYLLHIEGAGRLRLPDGRTMLVGYDGSNGRPYRSFGRYLLDKGLLSRAELSVQRIRQYLSSHPEIIDTVLCHNESYLFFKHVGEGPLGNIDVPLTNGRSLALDANLFPKAALAFISSRKPFVNAQGKVAGWSKFSRFVLNQDTGAAIKGPGRADLFWGSGGKAETAAWHFKADGDLYMLIKNP
jgi:membrane-bound lytic murein transglycosylase A